VAISSIKRIPIPKLTKGEIDIANLCSKALWYGIDFETGKNQTSDASLLETFATQFYQYHKNKTPLRPPIMELEVRELIRVCRVYVLYRGLAGMDFKKGISAIYKEIYNTYKEVIKKSYSGTPQVDGANCLRVLSDGIVKKKGDNRLNLSSRILFFLIPDLMIFNMNTKVATEFGLPLRPHYHYADFYDLFAKGLKTNQTLLSKLRLPKDDLNELTFQTWDKVRQTDWWQRRVLDIAILIKLNLATPHSNLTNLVEAKLLQNKIIK
jgi:hypothetical protein